MELKVHKRNITNAAFYYLVGLVVAIVFVPCVWASPFSDVIAPIEPIAPIPPPIPVKDESEYIEVFEDDKGPAVVKKLPSALLWDTVAESYKEKVSGDEYIYSEGKGAVSKFRKKYEKKPILKVKPIVPVAQRVEVLEDRSFVILPDDAPLPNGTISRDLLGEEPVLEVGPEREDSAVSESEIKKLTATLVEGTEGELYLKLEGNSEGNRIKNLPAGKVALTGGVKDKMAELIDKVTSDDAKSKKKEVSKVVKSKPKFVRPVVHNAKITFFADSILPENMEPMKKLAAKLKGKKIIKLHVTAQNSIPPIGIGEALPQERWMQVMKVFSAEGVSLKGVQTSEILLKATQPQFVDIAVEVKK